MAKKIILREDGTYTEELVTDIEGLVKSTSITNLEVITESDYDLLGAMWIGMEDYFFVGEFADVIESLNPNILGVFLNGEETLGIFLNGNKIS